MSAPPRPLSNAEADQLLKKMIQIVAQANIRSEDAAGLFARGFMLAAAEAHQGIPESTETFARTYWSNAIPKMVEMMRRSGRH